MIETPEIAFKNEMTRAPFLAVDQPELCTSEHGGAVVKTGPDGPSPASASNPVQTNEAAPATSMAGSLLYIQEGLQMPATGSPQRPFAKPTPKPSGTDTCQDLTRYDALSPIVAPLPRPALTAPPAPSLAPSLAAATLTTPPSPTRRPSATSGAISRPMFAAASAAAAAAAAHRAAADSLALFTAGGDAITPAPPRRAHIPTKSNKAVPIGEGGTFTSVYRGVTRHRLTGRYEAHFWDAHAKREKVGKNGRTRGRQVYLGGYEHEGDAAHAYDITALAFLGPTAPTNFPIEEYATQLAEMAGKPPEEIVGMLRRGSVGFARGQSQFRGVTKHHDAGKWEARIGGQRVEGNKYIYLGTFNSPDEAARAYDKAAVKFHGKKALTNYSLSDYQTIIDDPESYSISEATAAAVACMEAAGKVEVRRGRAPRTTARQQDMVSSKAAKITTTGTPAQPAISQEEAARRLGALMVAFGLEQLPVQVDAAGNFMFGIPVAMQELAMQQQAPQQAQQAQEVQMQAPPQALPQQQQQVEGAWPAAESPEAPEASSSGAAPLPPGPGTAVVPLLPVGPPGEVPSASADSQRAASPPGGDHQQHHHHHHHQQQELQQEEEEEHPMPTASTTTPSASAAPTRRSARAAAAVTATAATAAVAAPGKVGPLGTGLTHPSWPAAMVDLHFFSPCPRHVTLQKNECHFFCLGCTPATKQAMCQHCLEDHAAACEGACCRIYRCNYSDAVRTSDFGRLFPLGDVQSYKTSNGEPVAHLRPRRMPNAKCPAGFTGRCGGCKRAMMPQWTFCSLRCKLAASGLGVGSEEDDQESRPSSETGPEEAGVVGKSRNRSDSPDSDGQGSSKRAALAAGANGNGIARRKAVPHHASFE